MRRFDWQRNLPVGTDDDRVRHILRRYLLWSFFISLKAPLTALLEKNDSVAYVDGVLTAYKTVATIDYVMRGSLYGFVLLAAAMPFVALYFYSVHFQGSKSIYTMRRLPKRGELLRRCTLVPLLVMILSVVLFLMLKVAYYGFYVWVVPAEWREPGQWRRLWEGFLC